MSDTLTAANYFTGRADCYTACPIRRGVRAAGVRHDARCGAVADTGHVYRDKVAREADDLLAPLSAPAPGDFVTARPWVGGHETAPRRGIVGTQWGTEYVIVWFPSMNDGVTHGQMLVGRSVQPILISKLDKVTPLAEVTKTAVRNAYRHARRENLARRLPPEMMAAGRNLEAADRRRRGR
jgi:hypothetical protein